MTFSVPLRVLCVSVVNTHVHGARHTRIHHRDPEEHRVGRRSVIELAPMFRPGVSFALLAVIALQLLGSMAFACVEPCPDDTEQTSCPPVCTLCTSCTHAQTAIVQHSIAGTPLPLARPFAPHSSVPPSFALADDIFHVPLRG